MYMKMRKEKILNN